MAVPMRNEDPSKYLRLLRKRHPQICGGRKGTPSSCGSPPALMSPPHGRGALGAQHQEEEALHSPSSVASTTDTLAARSANGEPASRVAVSQKVSGYPAKGYTSSFPPRQPQRYSSESHPPEAVAITSDGGSCGGAAAMKRASTPSSARAGFVAPGAATPPHSGNVAHQDHRRLPQRHSPSRPQTSQQPSFYQQQQQQQQQQHQHVYQQQNPRQQPYQQHQQGNSTSATDPRRRGDSRVSNTGGGTSFGAQKGSARRDASLGGDAVGGGSPPPVPAAKSGSQEDEDARRPSLTPSAVVAEGEVVLLQRPNQARQLGLTTEPCPHCGRNFSAEAAVRHVPICARLKTRPKPPSKEQTSCYTDALGIRQGSRGALAAGNSNSRSRPDTPKSPTAVSSPTGSPKSASKVARSPLSGGGMARARGAPARPLSAKAAAPRTSEPPPMAPLVSPEASEGLSAQWGQLEFLLCDGLEATENEKAIADTLKTAERCMSFLATVEDYAARLGMRKGALSRLLLPFDLHTDAGYQANTASSMPLGSDQLRGLIPDHVRRELVSDAVALRRLIRVKVADCADLEQARDSLRLLVSFLRNLQAAAIENSCTTTAILRTL